MFAQPSILLVLTTLLWHLDLGASCCSSAATGGVGRLLRHERAMVEMSTNTRLTTGSFDRHARFKRGTTPSSPYLVVEPELAMVARLVDFFEPFAKLPVQIKKSDARVGARIGDITLGARAPLVPENIITNMPSLSLIGSVKMPTGTSAKDNPELLVEELSGGGAYLFSISAILEKDIKAVSLSAGYGLSVEPDYFRRDGLSPGLIHSPLMSVAFSPHDGGLLSFTWSMAIYGKPTLDFRPLPDASRRKMTIACAYSVSLHSHIKLNAQLGSDVPFDYIGKNFSNEAFLRIGLRFGVF